MQQYKSAKINTGIIAYEIVRYGINIKFRDGSMYLYTTASTGTKNIAQMQKLAKKGEGLTTYINQHVRDHYAEKIL